MKTRGLLTVTLSTGIFLLGALVARGLAQDQPSAPSQHALPDLVGGLKATPGCLGVELARTQSGKRLIFSWFEDKQAVLKWYYGEVHQQVIDQFFPDHDEYHGPLHDVPDDVGPIMVIVSITMSDRPHFEELTLPVSQISIELYKPIKGGLFFGGRFAPDGVKVPDMDDYTPKESE